MDLMPTDGQQVNLGPFRINPVFSKSLHCIHMKNDLSIVGLDNPGSLIYRLYRTRFIIHIHNGNQDRFRTESFLKVRQCHPSKPVYRKKRHPEAFLLFQITHGIQDSRMLYGCSDQMISPSLIGTGSADQRKIVTLRSAGSKENFLFLNF